MVFLPDRRQAEIDLVALDESSKRVRFGSCKRNESSHNGESLNKFEQHVAAFLKSAQHKKLAGWTIEKALFSPKFASNSRVALSNRGYTCRDLTDYAALV